MNSQPRHNPLFQSSWTGLLSAIGRTSLLPASKIGYAMWGMAGWIGSGDSESLRALNLAVELGRNFFDTAYACGEGRSGKLRGLIVRQNPERKFYAASDGEPLAPELMQELKTHRWDRNPTERSQ